MFRQAVANCLCQLIFDAELLVVAEALNSIFDVFVDERLDAIFAELTLLPQLRRAHSDFKSKVRRRLAAYCARNSADVAFAQLKRCAADLDDDVLAQAEEALTNLEAFIEYKQAH